MHIALGQLHSLSKTSVEHPALWQLQQCLDNENNVIANGQMDKMDKWTKPNQLVSKFRDGWDGVRAHGAVIF